jgi:acyl carrier protein
MGAAPHRPLGEFRLIFAGNGPIGRFRRAHPPNRQGGGLRLLLMADRPERRCSMTEDPQEKAKLIEEIVDVIAAEGMVDRSKITPDATIESLDLKSVDIVMILSALEERFNVYIPMDGSLQEAKDVKSLIEAIAEHIQKEREKA